MTGTATIVFEDEVNASVLGLDRRTARKCESELSFMQPHAYHTPAYKLGRWDGKSKMFKSQGGKTFISLLDRIVPILVAEGYTVDIEDKRTECQKPKLISKDIFSHINWPEGHPLEGEPIVLRDDQEESVNIFLENRYGLMKLPTSYGKTITTAAVSKALESLGRTITIVPSKSLVEQTLEDFINVGLDVGGIHGERKELGRTHTVTTWQSLSRLFDRQDPDEIGLIINDLSLVIVDECHQAKDATELKDMLSGYFRHVPYRLGLTGTIPKEDFQSIAIMSVLGNLIHSVPVKLMQEMGYIAKCEVHNICTKEGFKFKTYAEEMSFLSKDKERLSFIADAVDVIRSDGNTLVLVNSVEAGKKLNDLIPDSTFIYGKTTQKVRSSTYKGVNTEENTVVIATYQVAAVGINIPRIFNLVKVESGKSFIRVIQSIGRAIRVAKDKDFARVFDISSDCKYSKKHFKERKDYYAEMEYPLHKFVGSYEECIDHIKSIPGVRDDG